ncbi:peptide chain release factor N(5)-glutamine methyltransferase [Tessaracoccus flavescens]|uniref:peptide chain release factor N(5)-glutamine methyltransferase n=1 Tax=Tessaracoccus flavescens TaxID=399497 RepID=A0A1Q2D124_9ACTN|nr:peptide chain release factor N(5)-glutamine methyltransferase [Tessaracoccus flavescens]AQP52067.1 protein-(glutamine-N5) methyltransferase, release factor-specific [Tessaracoccus flavescens]
MSEAAFELAGRLTRSGSPSPGPEARIIVAHVLGVEVPRLIAVDDVTAEQQRFIDELAERRMAGEPLQHLTGVAYFRHEELVVGPGVFIPRPETEVMVGWALQRLAERDTRRVVELCAGSGAISAALATELGGLELHAVEVDPEAFAYLERNLEGRGVDLVRGDMATALPELDGTVDLVIVNPPYVPEGLRPFLPSDVVEHDPALALFSGEDGLDAIKVVAAVAMRLLAPGGILATEHDDSHQPGVVETLRAAGLDQVEPHADLTGRPRFVTAVRP